MEQTQQPELHKIRVYPENPKLPGLSNNLVIELDGKKLMGVVEFTYKADASNFPTVYIKMVAETQIESHARADLDRLNPQEDSVQF